MANTSTAAILNVAKSAIACLEVQAVTYRNWAKIRDTEANNGIAAEIERNVVSYRAVIADHSPQRVVLVYQGGIANVFAVKCFNMADYGRDAKRLLQSDFVTCQTFARGMAAAGAEVVSASCNQAGDIIGAVWMEGLEDCPFRDLASPVNTLQQGAAS